MKKFIFIVINLFFASAIAQNVQWGFKILEYSSEKTRLNFSASQALGLPNAMPLGTENINAWQPKGNSKEEFIKIGFITPSKIKQIVIVESQNPGYISKVMVYDAGGQEFELASYTPKKRTETSNVTLVNASSINFYVFAVKIVFETNSDFPIGIDAIGISESSVPYKLKFNPNDIIKSNMVAVKLDSNINSKYSEIGPLVSPDGKTLYFSRFNDEDNIGGAKDKEDIWFSTWNAALNNWNKAKNMGTPLNNKYPNFINSVSPDGNTILLGNSYLPDGTMDEGVSTSRRNRTGWNDPIRLNIEEDENNVGVKANYFQSNSQKILLISNHRKRDSYGDRDLYVSFVNKENTWSKPLNLGKNINTKGTEAAPFLASDDKTLYFTSDGLGGYGGSDIYMSKRLDNTWKKWSVPENLGPIVNTSLDESFLSISAAGDRVFFTSEKTEGTKEDIYLITLPGLLKPNPVLNVSGHVIDSKTNLYLADAQVFFEDLKTGLQVGIAHSSPDSGRFQIILPSGIDYGFLAYKEGYISVHSHIDITSLLGYQENHQDIYLTPIEAGQSIVINNIFFDFGKSTLQKKSYLELDRLVRLLKSSPTMQVEISGHTDNVGTVAYNDLLSIDRAGAVGYYLLRKSGVKKNRVIMLHLGELKPVSTNATAEGRELNRRVHFKILAE